MFDCGTCKYFDRPALSEPCLSCNPYTDDSESCKYEPANTGNDDVAIDGVIVDSVDGVTNIVDGVANIVDSAINVDNVNVVTLNDEPVDTNFYGTPVNINTTAAFDMIRTISDTLGFTMTYPEVEHYTSFSRAFMDIIVRFSAIYTKIMSASDKDIVTTSYDGDWQPQGIPIDIADIVILLTKICTDNGIDIGVAVNDRLAYIDGLNDTDDE